MPKNVKRKVRHTMERPVIISKEDKWYVAKDINSGVASQGHDVESALNNLKEALELYYEDNLKIIK